MATVNDWELRVYRGRTHASGEDVVTDASGAQHLYHISAEFEDKATFTSLFIRKGSASGDIIATVETPETGLPIIKFPTGWQTQLSFHDGMLNKRTEFKGFNGETFAWRGNGTFVAMALECFDVTTKKIVGSYKRHTYESKPAARFIIGKAYEAQIDLILASALAMEGAWQVSVLR